MSKLSELSARGLSYTINKEEAKSIFWITKQTVCELRLHGCTKKTSKREKGFNR